MFEILKSLKPNLNPKSIMIDYERAALNATDTEFCHTELGKRLFLPHVTMYLASCP